MGATSSGGWRLRELSSAYLRSAAEQAIDWFPWGAEAFEIARKSRRPILLDVGAAWCHWCHVMDEGTYSDGEVARLVNQYFVAVKVDRDEHPEVDRRYQRQVGAITGEGGWPLTAFLTPEGEVFLGGTYFPAVDGLGRPGFRRVLKEVARLWKDDPDRVRQHTAQVREALGAELGGPGATTAEVRPFLESVRTHVEGSFDPVYGGFGHAPKFPHPTAVSFLIHSSHLRREETAADKARRTLLAMANGGMYDQVGGGFHRYSVDEGWHVPHFEKMAIDNAALLAAYAEGYQRFSEPRLGEVAAETGAWMMEVLGDPAGGFGASQDADNAPGDDGSYFTWSRSELRSALPAEEFRLVTRFFGVGSDGRMPHDPDRNVLFRLMTLEEAAEGLSLGERPPAEVLAHARLTLRAERSRRATPAVDRALYANLNGLTMHALSRAGQVLGDARMILSGRRAADRFLTDAFSPEVGVAHRVEGNRGLGHGLLEDQVGFGLGLVELAGATLERRYLEQARAVYETVLKEWSGDEGLLRDVAPRLYDAPRVGGVDAPAYPVEDQPHLAGNAAAILGMLRLSSLTGEERWKQEATRLRKAAQRRLDHAGLFAAGTALAAIKLEVEPARVVVEGSGPESDALYAAALRAWHPNAWVFRGLPPEPFSSPEELRSVSGASASARALICFGTRCLPPVTEPAEIAARLASAGKPGPE
jgi:uncharacterized protein